jgi:glycosyltransferase involved in cell wall biosynthesis
MKKILFLQNVVFEYRKNLYNELSRSYEVSVLHTGKKSVNSDDNYVEHICDYKKIGPFYIINENLIEFCRNYDIVICMFDLYWLSFMKLIFYKDKPVFILWGHRYSENIISNNLRNYLMKKVKYNILYGEEDVPRMIKCGISSDRIFIAPNTIKVSNYKDYSQSEKSSLIFVGRLQESKKINILIQIFSNIINEIPSNITLEIIGDGNLEKSLKNLATNLGISKRVKFHGQINDAIILSKLFEHSFAYVSLGPVGLGVLHSFAYGIPVITLDKLKHGPEFHNLINNTNSFICSDTIQLEEKLKSICIDINITRRMGFNAFEYYIKNRKMEYMLDGFKNLLEKV